jgi:hypothetical protein
LAKEGREMVAVKDDRVEESKRATLGALKKPGKN